MESIGVNYFIRNSGIKRHVHSHSHSHSHSHNHFHNNATRQTYSQYSDFSPNMNNQNENNSSLKLESEMNVKENYIIVVDELDKIKEILSKKVVPMLDSLALDNNTNVNNDILVNNKKDLQNKIVTLAENLNNIKETINTTNKKLKKKECA